MSRSIYVVEAVRTRSEREFDLYGNDQYGSSWLEILRAYRGWAVNVLLDRQV